MLHARPRHQAGGFFKYLNAIFIGGLRGLGLRMQETLADLRIERGAQQIGRRAVGVARSRFFIADGFEALRLTGPFAKPDLIVTQMILDA
jgi:hypothetical protein